MRILGVFLASLGVSLIVAANLPMPRVLAGGGSNLAPEHAAAIDQRVNAAQEATRFMLISETLQRGTYFPLREELQGLYSVAGKAETAGAGTGDDLLFALSLKKIDDQISAFTAERDSWRLKIDIGGGILLAGGIAAFVAGVRKRKAAAAA